MRGLRTLLRPIAALSLVASILLGSQVAGATPTTDDQLNPGTVVMRVRGSVAPAAATNLVYQGGRIETGPKRVYLVYWGSQWSSDPSGEKAIEQNFFNGVGGTSWNNSVTQYCSGVAVGSTSCGTSGTHITNPTAELKGVWSDNTVSVPAHPTQNQILAEATKAAQHFGNTTAASNAQVQYVINTPTHHSMSGFGTSWCAWHDTQTTTSTVGPFAYVYMPYITDVGSTCGSNFNGLGPNAGITIVGGHEFAEAETDPFPEISSKHYGWITNTGSTGQENGDLCAWNTLTANITLSTGTFPVQPLWSNATSSCVMSF